MERGTERQNVWRDAEERGETKQDTKQETSRVEDKDKPGLPRSPSPAFMPGQCPAWPTLPGTHCPGPHRPERVLPGGGQGWGLCSGVARGQTAERTGQAQAECRGPEGPGWPPGLRGS